jgi:outer membrane biosynthesis protein TonB
MKPVRLIGTGALLLLFGICAPAFARQDKPDDHGGQDTSRPADHEQSKPAEQPKQPEAAPQKQSKPAEHQAPAAPAQQQTKPTDEHQQTKPAPEQQQTRAEKPAQQSKPTQQQQQQTKAEKPSTKPATRQTQQPQQARANQNQSGQRAPVRTASDQQRQRSQPAIRVSVRTSGRIPDDRFRSNFGREHNFRMGNPEMVGGYSRFQYGGFWFGFVDPWPADWYYQDEVYIDYIDGEYFMFDPYYPGERVEISVVL